MDKRDKISKLLENKRDLLNLYKFIIFRPGFSNISFRDNLLWIPIAGKGIGTKFIRESTEIYY